MGDTSNKQIDESEWIKVVSETLLDKNINNLSEQQKGMLRQFYLENLQEGMTPKEALKKAYDIVVCFNM